MKSEFVSQTHCDAALVITEFYQHMLVSRGVKLSECELSLETAWKLSFSTSVRGIAQVGEECGTEMCSGSNADTQKWHTWEATEEGIQCERLCNKLAPAS